MPEPETGMEISVVYSPAPRQVRAWTLDIAPDTTVGQALQSCGIFDVFPDLPRQGFVTGIWGKRVGPNKTLRQNDRIEIYRGLRVDPKVARRERFARQGAKGAGLFASVRPGAKAGY